MKRLWRFRASEVLCTCSQDSAMIGCTASLLFNLMLPCFLTSKTSSWCGYTTPLQSRDDLLCFKSGRHRT